MEMSYGDINFERFVSDTLFTGKGSFGEVYGPCNWNGKQIAIKKRMFSTEELLDREQLFSACRKWMSLHNERLITAHDVRSKHPAVYILMEYASGGSLRKVLSACKSDLPLEILKNWGIQIAEGMAHLHENGIVHRDLKSPNIVIMEEEDASSNPYNKTLKITDFDQIREHEGTKTTTNVGTCAWAAPEVLTGDRFSKVSDVWSYGVVLWEILTRNVPYKDFGNSKIIVYALKGKLKLEIPESCSDIIKSILRKCLNKEKDKRPTFDKILSDFQRNLSASSQNPKTEPKERQQSKSLGQRKMSFEDKNFKRFVSDKLLIGKGAFGEVYGPCDWKEKKCAIKKGWLNNVSEEDTEKELSACHNWMSLHHKRLITIYDVSLEPPAIYILMEYAGGGSLTQVLSALKSDLPLEILMDWGIQIAEGMAYLHENDIVHRDLKSPNILIMEEDASSNPYNKTLKVTDFDQIREHDGTQTMSFVGTCSWMAPEFLTEQRFSKASDVWSYGVVQWEILTRNVPYKDIPDHTIIANALKGLMKLDIPDSCPDTIKYMLNRCLSNEKGKRPSFHEILLELQRLTSGEDSKTYGFKKMDKDQSKSLGHRTVSYEDKNFSRFVSDDLFIGRGSFGDVYGPCDWKGKKCAIKKRWLMATKDTEKLLSACRKWMSLCHKHLITVYDVSLEHPAVYMLMEYASGGSLRKVLSACKSDLPLEILMDWGIQIAEGMAHLHENNIVHRNLKSSKIVIMEADASSNPYSKTLKITDDQIREHDGTQTMSNAGTCAWMAPEFLTEGRFSKASDIWSYGVVQWEILTRNVPYKDVADHNIIAEALKGLMKLEIPDSCPDIIKYIINGCLSNDKGKRPSFHEILIELQRLISAAGENLKATGLENMDKKQSKSLGHRIKKLFMYPKTTSLPQDMSSDDQAKGTTMKEAMTSPATSEAEPE